MLISVATVPNSCWTNQRSPEGLWECYIGNVSHDVSAVNLLPKNACTDCLWSSRINTPLSVSVSSMVYGLWLGCMDGAGMLQEDTALHKHSVSHLATVRCGNTHITVDKMSQCKTWGQFECLCPELFPNRNSSCAFLMSNRFLPGQETNI